MTSVHVEYRRNVLTQYLDLVRLDRRVVVAVADATAAVQRRQYGGGVT